MKLRKLNPFVIFRRNFGGVLEKNLSTCDRRSYVTSSKNTSTTLWFFEKLLGRIFSVQNIQIELTFFINAAKNYKYLTSIVHTRAWFRNFRMNTVDKVDVSEKSLERQILETMLFILNSRFLRWCLQGSPKIAEYQAFYLTNGFIITSILFVVPYIITSEMTDKKRTIKALELPEFPVIEFIKFILWQNMFESCDCIYSEVLFLRKFS